MQKTFSKIKEIAKNHQNILFIVLGIIVVVLFFINYKYDRQNIWLNITNNLFSEIISIIVTVFFVEQIVSKYEKKKRSKIEKRAKISIIKFVTHSLGTLLEIYDLRDKLIIKAEMLDGERIDLGEKITLKLDPQLLNDNLHDPENIYFKKFKSKLPSINSISKLKEPIESVDFILKMFSEDIDAAVIDLLHACRAELTTISRVHPSFLVNLEWEINNPKGRTPLHKDATVNTYAYIFSDSFSRAIIRLNELYNLVET